LLHHIAFVLEGETEGQADLIVVFDEQQPVHFPNTVGGVSAAQAVNVTETAQFGPDLVTRRRDTSARSRCIGGAPTPPGAPPGASGLSFGALVTLVRLGKMDAVRDPGPAPATTTRPRRLSLGLRARVTVAFAIAGLVVAVGLSLITYSLARSFLLQQ